jgi:hypothetical protein
VKKTRGAGILIIHAPSETMDFYSGSEGRKLAQSAPHVEPPDAAPLNDPPLPIDDSNGGCDTPGDTEHRAWSRETPSLTIAHGDVISESGAETYNVLREHGIDTVFYMGVHANMCILNRSFGIRQMARWGFIASWCATSRMPCMSLHRVPLCLIRRAQNSSLNTSNSIGRPR